MTPTETTFNEPEDAETRYDLAGNPLPPLPKADVPLPVPGVHYAPASSASLPAFTPPPGSARYVPPPGSTPPPGYMPPPGPVSLYAPAAPAKAPQGPALYAGLGVGLLLLIGLIFGIRALKPTLVAAPTAYKTYAAIDNSFSCDQPGGWTLHETGATSGNLATSTFESGHARVRVVSDAMGSLMADITSSSNANLPPAMQVPAVEKLHIRDKKQLADSIAGYKEDDFQKFQSSMGDARVSEWTATGGIGTGSLHGYRVTMLGREREFTVICFCPQRNWSVLMPAFLRIINSLKQGSGN